MTQADVNRLPEVRSANIIRLCAEEDGFATTRALDVNPPDNAILASVEDPSVLDDVSRDAPGGGGSSSISSSARGSLCIRNLD